MAKVILIKEYKNGVVPTEEQLDAAFNSILDALNIVGMGSDNLAPLFVDSSLLAANSVAARALAPGAGNARTVADGAVTPAKLAQNVTSKFLPVGFMKFSPVITSGSIWLPCDGQSLDTTTYAELFSVIGYTFGGSGSSFNLPDLQDRWVRHRVPAAPGFGQFKAFTTSPGSRKDASDTTEIINKMKTTVEGSHSHSITMYYGGTDTTESNAYNIAPPWDFGGNRWSKSTTSAGSHTHTLGGGDPRTAPDHINQVLYIKVK